MNKIKNYILLIFLFQPLSASNIMYLEPVNISVLNSDKDEYAPSWNSFTSNLFFTSTKKNSEKLFTTKKNADGFFEPPIYLEHPINRSHNNLSYIDFVSPDKAYFSTFLFDGTEPRLQIYYSNFKKKAWSEGFIIDEFASPKFVGHSSISVDGNQLAFTTQSGEGDLDIMISYRLQDGTWRDPIPMDIMNSTGDEITPHFASSDTLFFASDGQSGPGGFDIYFSVKSEGIWQRPSPLYEINTEYDESDVCNLPNGDIIFASNRPGGKGGLDLWLATNNSAITNNLERQPIKIDLQSYINNIVINNNYEYTNLPVASTFFLQDSTKELQDDFFDYKTVSELQQLDNIEESYYNSLNYIAHKMNKFKEAKLKITAVYPGQLEVDSNNSKNSKYFADLNIKKIIDYLQSKFNISNSQITYNYDFYQDNSRKPVIELSSNEAELFSQYEIRNDNIKLDQKFLPFDVKIEPEINLNSWLATIELNNNETIVYENTKNKDRVTIDLSKYKEQLFESDYLSLVIKAYSNNGDSTVSTITHSIEHHHSKKPKLIKEENQLYDFHYILSGINTSIDNNSYKSSIEKIYNSITMCKSIEIKYNRNKALANSIKEKIQSKITSSQLKVKLTKNSGYLKNAILDDNLIIVKVEKYSVQSSSNY